MHSVLLSICLFSLSEQAVWAQGHPKPGMWRGWLESPGGELPFQMELVKTGPIGFAAYVHNGRERLDLGSMIVGRGVGRIISDHYASSIPFGVNADGTGIEGTWVKRRGGNEQTQMPFHAVFDDRARFKRSEDWKAPSTSIAGRWAVEFEKTDGPAVGVFEQDNSGVVTGTFLTTTGDYRYLEGDFDGKRLRLSTFDGAHAFLFHATVGDDGTLSGDFWSRETWHETWKAKRDAKAELPDAFGMNKSKPRIDLGKLKFLDMEGTPRTLSEKEFSGKAIILDVFGSWCPNCNDAAVYLNELYDELGDRGLSIVGLAFELAGDPERDTIQLKYFRKRHEIKYPLLLAGSYDKDDASRVLPFLDKVIAYPTLIILDADGDVKAVHTGFSGPATGPAYEVFKRRMREILDPMLAG